MTTQTFTERITPTWRSPRRDTAVRNAMANIRRQIFATRLQPHGTIRATLSPDRRTLTVVTQLQTPGYVDAKDHYHKFDWGVDWAGMCTRLENAWDRPHKVETHTTITEFWTRETSGNAPKLAA